MTTDTTVRFDSDLDMVKRAQEGNADAFASLFHNHKARIYSVCLRMTNNTAEAEDLTQDAFLQVFRKLSTFRGDSALSTWLYRIAVNTVLMHFRKKALRQISLDEPYSQDAKQVRREYGSRDDRLTGSVIESRWRGPLRNCLTAIAPYFYCTKSKVTSTRRSPNYSTAPWETPSRNCTRPNCAFVNCSDARVRRTNQKQHPAFLTASPSHVGRESP